MRKEEGVRGITRKKREVQFEGGEEVFVVTEEGRDGKGCGERVEAHVRGDKGMVESNKDSCR